MSYISIKELMSIVGGSILNGDMSIYADYRINDAKIDSRGVGAEDVFVPIPGEHVDPHCFIPQVLAGDCCVSLTQEDAAGYEGDKIIIKVDDCLDALQKLGSFYRNRIKVPVVAVAGSVGKTTTKEMIAAALSAGGKVYKTRKSLNSQRGVSLTMMEFDEEACIAVIELGISVPGEMKKIAAIARPDCAVYTNIGVTHIENFGSREEIMKEKLKLTDVLPDGANVYLNRDNDLLREAVIDKRLSTVYYGTDPDCSVYAEDIRINDGFPQFTAVVYDTRVKVSLKIYGLHMINNALAALAVCRQFGVDLNAAAEKISAFEGIEHRQQIKKKDGITVIDDSYNANPDSMKAAVQILSDIDCRGRRVAVLADMNELGDISCAEHIKIRDMIAQLGNIDTVITFGKKAEVINPDLSFDRREDIDAYLKQYVRDGDVILFKGSNTMRLFDCVDALMNGD